MKGERKMTTLNLTALRVALHLAFPRESEERVKKTVGAIMHGIMILTPEDRADLMEDIIERLTDPEDLGAAPRTSALNTFMGTVSRNMALSFLRHSWTARRDDGGSNPELADGGIDSQPDYALQVAEAAAARQAVLDAMGEREREVMGVFLDDSLDVAEKGAAMEALAVKFGLTLGSLRNLATKCVKELAEAVEAAAPEASDVFKGETGGGIEGEDDWTIAVYQNA
jgi:DNA-directed RNA polymerase specialized sigma24 family protein